MISPAASSLQLLWLQSIPGINSATIAQVAPLVLMFVALYFLMIVPNQRKQKTWAAMLEALKSGDRITTTGGIRGTILSVKDDVVTLRIPPDNLKLEVIKSAIASVTTEEPAAK